MSESNIQASPGSIFICYRREDSADVTGRIYVRDECQSRDAQNLWCIETGMRDRFQNIAR